ncbi:type II secretion system ATPase PulE [Sulfurimicrobium lacus]|uniref:Type II secretion system ATPase PulE n=1 Tax=Sulfurimicrobium lacus TaxID=2715678 RepID=A0A6F8VD61_9PROT|nr:GspE/PulE family protein [Sulfurimicrobium lacus]BCB27614.1 type II secretion system ATPase PulE [Sulfurimicrobium lacus]
MNIAEQPVVPAATVFSPQQVHAARETASALRRRVIEVLEEQSNMDPRAFTQTLADTLHYAVLGMVDLHRLAPAFEVLPFAEAVERECIALRGDGGRLTLVMSDPFDIGLQAWAEQRIGESFDWGLAHHADLAAYLARQEDSLHAMDSVLALDEKASTTRTGADELSFKTISEDTSPVVKLVHSTVYDALKIAASDIHLETGPSGLGIKYRIDGVLTTVGSLAGLDLAEQVISRIKVMSELDIAERRVPQDGRFKVAVRGHEVDFRVSIMPSIFGEDAVLRILDKQTLTDQIKGLRLGYLGFDDDSIAVLRRLSSAPYGMLLVTGPTGSGKTTTLYAAISEINNGQDKIITIEDPVEYQLPGVLQIPVNEKKGLTFARGLRSILRHDPDKIMVGEIRDPETAQIAVQSALTGHLVFTTVHANNVFDVLGRFTHMGVDPYSFVSALNGIMAQRLVRVNCPHCTVEQVPDEQLIADSGIDKQDAVSMRFRAGTGCGQCRGTGFKGRKAIGEILVLNDQIRELIINREPARVIREAARRNGTHFLRETAVEMVRQGETTLQEINRVTFVA